MSRRRSVLERMKRKAQRRKCPYCLGNDVLSKEYSDAWLHVCQNPECGFPVRVVK